MNWCIEPRKCPVMPLQYNVMLTGTVIHRVEILRLRSLPSRLVCSDATSIGERSQPGDSTQGETSSSTSDFNVPSHRGTLEPPGGSNPCLQEHKSWCYPLDYLPQGHRHSNPLKNHHYSPKHDDYTQSATVITR